MVATRVLDFFVPGIPIPEGSLKALNRRGTKQPIVIHQNSPALTKWRTAIAEMARYYMGVKPVFESDAIELTCVFTVPRPRTVTREYPTVPPDLDKLMRSVGDALTGIVYGDDAQSVDLHLRERYEGHAEAAREGPGVHIIVSVRGRLLPP